MGVLRGASQNHLSFVAAGAAFYAFLAIPAAVAVLASLSLLIFGPGPVQRGVGPVERMVPGYVIRLLEDPHSRQTLGIGFLISLLLDLGSIHSGSSCMLTALGLIHGQNSKRSFISRQLTVLALAAIMVPFTLLSLVLLVVLPRVIDLVSLTAFARATILLVRWPILMALFLTVLAAIYRYAPHRTGQSWRWTSWGAVLATVLWVAVSGLFAAFADDFAPRDRTFGMLGALMGLLTWLNFTALMILLRAQIDAEMER